MELLELATQTRYPIDAFLFVQRGLDFTVRSLHGEPDPSALEDEDAYEADAETRHVSGPQLCQGLRDFAIDQYGLMAQTVLRRWRITNSEDFGHIVFAMVDANMMRKTDNDQVEDFYNVFDFDEAFAPQLSLSDNA